MRFVKPNLPDAKVRLVIADCRAPSELFEYFQNNKIEYIPSLVLKNCIDAVSSHPDMQICCVGEGSFVCEPSTYEYYKNKLKIYDVNISAGSTKNGSNYPYDIAYNVVITGNFMMHNTKYTDAAIARAAKSSKHSIRNVKQGYTKCASCIVGENAFITSDNGIYRACVSNGIDCLSVGSGEIMLGERKDGFLGGCCGKISHDKLLFCGNPQNHCDYDKIRSFAKKHGVTLVSAFNGPLTDIGSIIPVMQE